MTQKGSSTTMALVLNNCAVEIDAILDNRLMLYQREENMAYDFAITKDLPDLDYDDAVARVTEELKKEGFGVLTEIDVKATLKKKIDVDFRRYVILGACNPPLAHKALQAEPLIGVLLPCNVVVMERDGGGSSVAAFSPIAGFDMLGKDDIRPVAEEVEERMKRMLDRLP